MNWILITKSIRVNVNELEEKFVRSSGPGGQNVNKLATAVQLRFDVRNSPHLPDRVKQKILASGDSRLTKDGKLVIIAESKRTQEGNRRDALSRLKGVICKAAYTPKPRIASKPTKGFIKRRLESKAKRAMVKKTRNNKMNSY